MSPKQIDKKAIDVTIAICHDAIEFEIASQLQAQNLTVDQQMNSQMLQESASV